MTPKAKMRPKRMYPLPAHLRPKAIDAERPRFGWRGFGYYIALLVGFAAPQAYSTWRFALSNRQWDVFWLLTAAWIIVVSVFAVIARPWERRPW